MTKSFSAALVAALAALACSFSTPSAADPQPASTAPASYAKPSGWHLRAELTPLQFSVTQDGATERPYDNAYWDNHEAGLYVDVVTGEPLFSSRDKFDSGTGWPSFTRPIETGRIVERHDDSLAMDRTEVRSHGGDSHLGHVFDDGPAPTHMRYCINSASLRFIPEAKLAALGYGAYRVQVAAGR